MSKVIKYSNEEQYDNDLKYWSNSSGDLYHLGQESITEDELPEETSDEWSPVPERR